MKGKVLGLAPLLLVLAVLVAFVLYFYPEPIQPPVFRFDLPSPFSSAHSIFLSLSALIVAYFFGRGFISNGSLGLLLLGGGSLILGFGFLASQILGSQPFGGPNQLVGMSSMSFLAAGAFYGAFATVSLSGRSAAVIRVRAALAYTYAAGILLVLGIILIFETSQAPSFFQPGAGPTLLRQQVLGSAIVLFAYTSIVLMRDYGQSRSGILFWFSFGLAAVSVGFLSAFLGKVPGGLFSWLGRFSVALGGIYFILAIREAYKDEKGS